MSNVKVNINATPNINVNTYKSSVPVQSSQKTITLKGDPGKSIEFNWDGTSLGIRQEGDATYTYRDLVGPPGQLPSEGNVGDILVKTTTGAAWEEKTALTSREIEQLIDNIYL